MNITTIPRTDRTALLVVDCEDSTAVSKVVVSPFATSAGDETFVHVVYRSGAEWGYFVPNIVALVGLGERSVGRFVASVVKPNATYAYQFDKERVAVGV